MMPRPLAPASALRVGVGVSMFVLHVFTYPLYPPHDYTNGTANATKPDVSSARPIVSSSAHPAGQPIHESLWTTLAALTRRIPTLPDSTPRIHVRSSTRAADGIHLCFPQRHEAMCHASTLASHHRRISLLHGAERRSSALLLTAKSCTVCLRVVSSPVLSRSHPTAVVSPDHTTAFPTCVSRQRRVVPCPCHVYLSPSCNRSSSPAAEVVNHQRQREGS